MIRRYFLFILIFLNDFKLIDLAYVKIHHFDIIIISAIFAGFGQKSTQEVINNNIRHYTEKEKWRTYVKKINRENKSVRLLRIIKKLFVVGL